MAKLRGCSGTIVVGATELIAQDINLDVTADEEEFAGEGCSTEVSVGPVKISGSCRVVVDTAVDTAAMLAIGATVTLDIQSEAGTPGSTGDAVITGKKKVIPRKQGMQEVEITFRGTETGDWVLDF